MDYIVVDFEWNQSTCGKSNSKKKLLFEIIEIGAVKLNKDRQIIDSFSRFIKPKVHKQLHYITQELTGISITDLSGSEGFKEVVGEFLAWCGEDFIFCTWGDLDLIELQRNLKYYHLEDLLIGPLKYFNVQKLFKTLCYKEEKNTTMALETAVDLMKIEKKEEFHRAINDAKYTADIFCQMDIDEINKNYSIDYYENPKSKKEEIKVIYETYSKYISREFETKELAMEDREVRSTKCYKCQKKANKKIRWFTSKTKLYYCVAYCEEHGYLKGRIKLKKTDEGKIFVIKTLELIDEQGVEEVKEIKKEIRKKRREKRRKEV